MVNAEVETENIKPPQRYGEVRDLEAIFSGLLPQIVREFSPLLAKRTPKVSKNEGSRFLRKLRRFLQATRPYLLALGALKGELDATQCKYALLEGLLREQYRAGGIRIPEKLDAWAFHLGLVMKAARSNLHLAKVSEYKQVREALAAFSEHLSGQLPWPLFDKALNQWAKSADARKYLQFVGQWPTLVQQFRSVLPRRLTPKLANQLANEHRISASFLEQRLRLMVYLSGIAHAAPSPWAEWQKKSLKQLQDLAQGFTELKLIAGLVDRHVRNALAHGVPELLYDSAQVRFHDRETAVTWKFREFFENTRRLTFGAIALAEFEALCNLCWTRKLVKDLWTMATKHSPTVNTTASSQGIRL